MFWWSIIKLWSLIVIADCARILVVIPTPSVSHQVVFRPITQELVRRGHEVVFITTDPAFPKGQAPANLTEIDVNESSYVEWRKHFVAKTCTGRKKDIYAQILAALHLLRDITIKQMKTDEVQKIFNKKEKFDLLILEGWARPALVFSHFFKAPAILASSFGGFFGSFEAVGAPVHPLMYPTSFSQRINNRNIWDKIAELYNQYQFYSAFNYLEKVENEAIWDNFGYDVPPLSELRKNVHMLFLNVYPVWDSNRPVPPSVVYMGGIHKNPEKKLPEDLESYLNSSKNGVIYVSFGTNVKPSDIPSDKIQAMVEVFSGLPYDVLWKWDKDEMPGRTKNIKILKWLPQSDLLRHPKIKLFVMQGGLQSTDEAILAGVPLLGIPMLGDQWFNTEMFVKHGLGCTMDMDTMTSAALKKTVETVINDKKYRRNVIKFRSLIYDQPETPLDRVIWWIEHIIRHGGGSHLRAPAIDMPWAEYCQLDIIATLLLGAVAFIIVVIATLYYTYVFIICNLPSMMKLKVK